jgi:hypothetical protein
MSKSLQLARYRAAQFFAAAQAGLAARRGSSQPDLTTDEVALIASILPAAAQQALFHRMSTNDRRHALAVLQTLRQAGHTDLALLQAALLHDMAKSLGQPLGHRVLIVLFNAFWPAALARLARLKSTQVVTQVGPWRRPFVIHAQHPTIGAAWAEAARCEPVAVQLIACHQDKLPSIPANETERLLAALQWADNLN